MSLEWRCGSVRAHLGPASEERMDTINLVAVELPNSRFAVRVKNGRRLGTIFQTERGWYYQFDGTAHEGPRCKGPDEALEIMEAVAQHEHMLDADQAR